MSELDAAWQKQIDAVARPAWAASREVDVSRDPKTGEVIDVGVTDTLIIPVEGVANTTVTVEQFFDFGEDAAITQDPIKVFVDHMGLESVPSRETVVFTPDQIGSVIDALVKVRLALTGAAE